MNTDISGETRRLFNEIRAKTTEAIMSNGDGESSRTAWRIAAAYSGAIACYKLEDDPALLTAVLKGVGLPAVIAALVKSTSRSEAVEIINALRTAKDLRTAKNLRVEDVGPRVLVVESITKGKSTAKFCIKNDEGNNVPVSWTIATALVGKLEVGDRLTISSAKLALDGKSSRWKLTNVVYSKVEPPEETLQQKVTGILGSNIFDDIFSSASDK